MLTTTASDHEQYLPALLPSLDNPQTALPAIAKDERLIAAIEDAVRDVPTRHRLELGDARWMNLEPESVQLCSTRLPIGR